MLMTAKQRTVYVSSSSGSQNIDVARCHPPSTPGSAWHVLVSLQDLIDWNTLVSHPGYNKLATPIINKIGGFQTSIYQGFDL